MRILFITPSAYILGGLATWLSYLDPALNSKGWDVTIGLVEGPRYHRPKRYLSVYQHKKWISISCRTGTPEGRTKAIIQTIRNIHPDIIVTVNIPDVYSAISRLRFKGLSTPKVVTALHGIQTDLYDDILANNSILDGVVCTNLLSCQLTHVLGGVHRKRIYYAPYGIKVSFMRPYSVKKKYLEIVYIGRLEQQQKRILDIPLILEQLERMKIPFRLSIAGDGPDEESLRYDLNKFINEGKVRFLGFLSKSELQSKLYLKADVLLLTSLWETGPIVIWEAMVSGLAIVSSQYIGSGLEGALEHEKNALLFPVGETRLAAQYIARLWNDSAFLKYLLNNAHNMVRQRYTIESSVRYWDNALQHTLKAEELPKCAELTAQPTTGRLNKWFNPQISEILRQLLRVKGPDCGPGGEWPHSYGYTPNYDPHFWQIARTEDRKVSD